MKKKVYITGGKDQEMSMIFKDVKETQASNTGHIILVEKSIKNGNFLTVAKLFKVRVCRKGE